MKNAITVSDFNTGTPAWRIKRLRQLLREAFERGLDMKDDGLGLEHRAELRSFNAARADILGEIISRTTTARDGLLDGMLTVGEADLISKKNRRLLRAYESTRRCRLSSGLRRRQKHGPHG